MKKIGILTQPLRCNYGGVIQNYALQKTLSNLNFHSVTIDQPAIILPINLKWLLRFIKRAIEKTQGINDVTYINYQKQLDEEYNLHRKFINKYINYIEVDYPLSSSITQEQCFEGYVVGSDQVWRCDYATNLSNCFLDFTKGQNVKRVSYAASLGASEWKIPQQQTIIVRESIKKFDGISVREADAINLCKKNLDVEAIQVVDPTLLLTADQYRQLLSESDYDNSMDVAVYILDLSSKKKKIADQICRKIGKKPYYIGHCGNNHSTIEQWIAAFDKAQYIITDSFHGSVFSIIFGKQFTAIGNTFRGLSRFNSLFSMLEIDNEIVDEEQTNVMPSKEIDYNKVSAILAQKREDSYKFLRDSLC